MPEAKIHYPFLTRLILEMFNAGELPAIDSIDLETDFGYVGRILYKAGAVRYFKGSNLNVNLHANAEIALDKGYTKYFLQQFGYETPIGKTFLTPLFFKKRKTRLMESDAPVNTLKNIPAYVEEVISYPCYIKPNDGSQGHDVHRADDRTTLDEVLAWFETAEHEVVLVEAVVHLPEYRIVVYENEVICCYGRYPLIVFGDGKSTIRQLLDATEARYTQAGRPPAIDLSDHRIADTLRQQGLTLHSTLAQGASAKIYDSANLSIGGTARDFTDELHPQWKNFAIELVQKFNLTLCGLDFCCSDITQPNAIYSILEINATPTLSGYATLGTTEYQRVRNLYHRILSEVPNKS
jgi:D-alanine-D-alanine ligase-like ATP-grasp enzyme